MSTSAVDDKEALISSNEDDETTDDSQPKPIMQQPGRQPMSPTAPPETLDEPDEPIVKQPVRHLVPLEQSDNWIPDPIEIALDQPHLEYLEGLDHLFLYQKVHLCSVFTTWVTSNDYTVTNDANGDTLHAVEENHCLIRNTFEEFRPFEIKVLDHNQRELFHLSRPLRCIACCFPCFLQELTVTTPFGYVIGYVKQEWSIRMPKFQIQTPSGETVLRVYGPSCPCSMCCHVEFVVTSEDGSTELGRIIKRWSGLVLETFTHADHFEITFPVDLDTNLKAALVGTCLLIDYMYFE